MFARNTVLAIVATALLACGSMLAAAEPPANPPPLRIGTYDTRALALVYYRSAEFGEEMSRLTAERDKAKAAGDQKRVDELQTQGQNSQRRAHAQGFSNAPIDNILILPRFKDAIAAVAKDAKVAAVVPSVDWHDAAIQTVDVTDQLVAQPKPDDQTKKMAAELRQHPPIDLVQAVMMKD